MADYSAAAPVKEELQENAVKTECVEFEVKDELENAVKTECMEFDVKAECIEVDDPSIITEGFNCSRDDGIEEKKLPTDTPRWVLNSTSAFKKVAIPRLHAIPRLQRVKAYPPYELSNQFIAKRVFVGSSSIQDPLCFADLNPNGILARAPGFNSDPRSSSSLTEGSNRTGRFPLITGIDGGFTFSASWAAKYFLCLCRHGATKEAGHHKLDTTKPIVFVLGDACVPPVLGGGGRCAIVIRVDQGSPDQLKLAVKKFFDIKLAHKQKKGSDSPVPPGSVFLISLNTWMMMVGHCAYISEMNRFVGWLERYIVLGYDSDSESGPGFDPDHHSRISDRRIHCVLVPAPYSGTLPCNAAASLAVMHAETIAHGEAGKPLLGLVSSTCEAFMKERCETSVEVSIEALYCRIPAYCGARGKFVRTEPCRTSVACGLAQETLTPQLLHDFWCKAFERTRGFIEADVGTGKSSNAPSATNLSDGIRDVHRRGIDLSTTFPEVIHSDHALASSAQPSAMNTVYVVGYSHGGLIFDRLKRCVKMAGLNLSVKRLCFPHGRANADSMKAVGRTLAETAKEGDFVVLDSMCSVLLTYGGRNLVEDIAPISLVKTLKDKKKVMHLAATSDGSVLRMQVPSMDHVECSIRCISDFCSAMQGIKVKVVVLGPLPRFPTKCCSEDEHGFVTGQSSGIFNRLLRDINTFVSRSARFNDKGALFGLPFQCAVSGLTNPWSGSGVVKTDNVHLLDKHVATLASAALEACLCLRDGRGWAPTIPADVSFSEWLPYYRHANGAGDGEDGALQPVVDVSVPLTDGPVRPPGGGGGSGGGPAPKRSRTSFDSRAPPGYRGAHRGPWVWPGPSRGSHGGQRGWGRPY